MIDNFCLIIGSGKCGTTSLFSYLAQHPQISACSLKEPGFFSEDQIFNKGIDWYYKLWNWNPSQHKIALEASTSYTKIPFFNNVPKQIYQSQIQAKFKFIYLMRNPIEKIESHFRYSGKLVPESHQIEPGLIETSRYAYQIDEYYKQFPAENILLLKFEELKDNPFRLLNKVCQFLEIDESWNFQNLDKVYNASKDRVFDDPIWQALKQVKLLYTFAKYIPDEYKNSLHHLLGQRRQLNHQLSIEQRNFILCKLQNDLQKLNRKYGIDLENWGIPSNYIY